MTPLTATCWIQWQLCDIVVFFWITVVNWHLHAWHFGVNVIHLWMFSASMCWQWHIWQQWGRAALFFNLYRCCHWVIDSNMLEIFGLVWDSVTHGWITIHIDGSIRGQPAVFTAWCVQGLLCPWPAVTKACCVHDLMCPSPSVSAAHYDHDLLCPRLAVSTARCDQSLLCPWPDMSTACYVHTPSHIALGLGWAVWFNLRWYISAQEGPGDMFKVFPH